MHGSPKITLKDLEKFLLKVFGTEFDKLPTGFKVFFYADTTTGGHTEDKLSSRTLDELVALSKERHDESDPRLKSMINPIKKLISEFRPFNIQYLLEIDRSLLLAILKNEITLIKAVECCRSDLAAEHIYLLYKSLHKVSNEKLVGPLTFALSNNFTGLAHALIEDGVDVSDHLLSAIERHDFITISLLLGTENKTEAIIKIIPEFMLILGPYLVAIKNNPSKDKLEIPEVIIARMLNAHNAKIDLSIIDEAEEKLANRTKIPGGAGTTESATDLRSAASISPRKSLSEITVKPPISIAETASPVMITETISKSPAKAASSDTITQSIHKGPAKTATTALSPITPVITRQSSVSSIGGVKKKTMANMIKLMVNINDYKILVEKRGREKIFNYFIEQTCALIKAKDYPTEAQLWALLQSSFTGHEFSIDQFCLAMVAGGFFANPSEISAKADERGAINSKEICEAMTSLFAHFVLKSADKTELEKYLSQAKSASEELYSTADSITLAIKNMKTLHLNSVEHFCPIDS